jgi:hypothetical protein
MQIVKLSIAITLAFAVLMHNPAFDTDPTQPERIPDPDATIMSTNVTVTPNDPAADIGSAHVDTGTVDPSDWEYDTSANDGATGHVHADAIIQWKDGTVRTLTADTDVTQSSGEGAKDTLDMEFHVKDVAPPIAA